MGGAPARNVTVRPGFRLTVGELSHCCAVLHLLLVLLPWHFCAVVVTFRCAEKVGTASNHRTDRSCPLHSYVLEFWFDSMSQTLRFTPKLEYALASPVVSSCLPLACSRSPTLVSPVLVSSADDPNPAYSAMTAYCLGILLGDRPPFASRSGRPRPRSPSSSAVRLPASLEIPAAPANTTTAPETMSMASSTSTTIKRQSTVAEEVSDRRKRARSGARGFTNAPRLPASGAAGAVEGAAALNFQQGGNARGSDREDGVDAAEMNDRHQAAAEGPVGGDATESEEAGDGSVALPLSTTFPALVAAAEALAELVRAADNFSEPIAEGCNKSTDVERRIIIEGHENCNDDRNGSTSGGCLKPERSSGAEAGARDLVLMEASRRAGSNWAWERELAYLLIGSCGRSPDNGRGGDENVDEDIYSQAKLAAEGVVDRALSATHGLDVLNSTGGKVFQELEGVDTAVGAACNGLIRVLLQVKV